jgi:O-antigen ligase
MTVMFMGMSALCGCALWLSGAKKTLLKLPIAVPVGALAVTTLLSRSTGAQVLMLAGIGALFFMRYARNPLPVVATALFVIAYVVLRGGGLWDGQDLIRLADDAFGSERASSLETRIANENALAAKARQRPLLGWGGWGRNRVKDDWGRDASITDGLWVIIFGTNGVIGIAAFLGTMLVPVVMLTNRIPPRFWMHPSAAAATVGALICCLWAADCIPNSMFNPIYMVTAGGLAGLRKVRPLQRQPARNLQRTNGLPQENQKSA